MKLLAKPKSSPPPLIMFPRSKSTRATRSRDSRAHPMFVRKINETNNEPSSPKVTCIGQVRVNRSKNKQQTRTKTKTTSFAAVRRRMKQFRRVWRGRYSCFGCECWRKPEKLEEIQDVIGAVNDELIGESEMRNEVLLTRSRSAPDRINEGDEVMMEEVVVKEESRGDNGEDEDSINGDEEFEAKVNVKPLKDE